MYQHFTDRARKVMQFANQEAIRCNHEYIGTEHILLGLIKEGSGVAANVLKSLNIDPNRVRGEIEKIIMAGPDKVTTGKLPKTPRANRVIELAIDEAKNLNHNYVGTEHLLLGLVREGEGVASQVLMNLGLSLAAIREEILNLLGHAPDKPVALDKPLLDFDKPLLDFDKPVRPADLPVAKAVKHLDEVIEFLTQMKEEAIIDHDFDGAASFRDQVDKLHKVKTFLVREKHRAEGWAEVKADITVESTSPAVEAPAHERPSYQFEIHIPATSHPSGLDPATVEHFLRKLAQRFGPVYCLRVPNAVVYEDPENGRYGEGVWWWFFATDRAATADFLRDFRKELQETLGLDKIVLLYRKVTLL